MQQEVDDFSPGEDVPEDEDEVGREEGVLVRVLGGKLLECGGPDDHVV